MTDDPRPPASAPTTAHRDAAVERLTRAFTDGQLEMEDFEQRLEIVMRATTLDEIALTFAGLGQPAPVDEPVRVPAPPFRTDRPRASRRTVVIMSAASRKGRWVLQGMHKVFAFMGGAKLDLREAELVEAITDIRVNAFMGGVQVIVPPDVDVEVDGWAIMGGIDQRDIHPAPLESQVRRVRITARIVMGGVEVRVRERKAARAEATDQLEERRRKKRLREG